MSDSHVRSSKESLFADTGSIWLTQSSVFSFPVTPSVKDRRCDGDLVSVYEHTTSPTSYSLHIAQLWDTLSASKRSFSDDG